MFLKTSQANRFLFLWRKRKKVFLILLGWPHPHLTWVHVSHNLNYLDAPMYMVPEKLLKDAATAQAMAFN